MKKNQVPIAGVIVLYNPDENVIENINSYLDDIFELYAIDNSEETINRKILDFLVNNPKIHYLPNYKNQGIAWALNKAAILAIRSNYNWLLTMDQDSKATPFLIPSMQFAFDFFSHIGIISPIHSGEKISKNILQNNFVEVDSVMTSGNLLNLKAYEQIGPFEEKLFIDYVDHEFCLRLKKNKYKVILSTKAYLEHNLGQIKCYRIGSTTNHSAVRRYYITRNRLLINKLYKNDFPLFCQNDLRKMWKELIKICFLEKNKINKILAFIKGFYHFKINRFGKL